MTQSTSPTAYILSQGDEVVTGQVADTNAAWLSDQLTAAGVQVIRHVSVGDHLPDLVQLFREASTAAELVLCTGGLGPTDDDLTAEAVARAFAMPLQLDDQALTQLVARYRALGRTMAEVNRKQCLLPTGSARLDNAWGTAPGFATQPGRAWMVFLPGVPREMKRMFDVHVRPRLHALGARPRPLVTLRTAGVGESDLQQRLVGLSLPDDVQLSFRTALPENHIKLRFPPDTDPAAIHGLVAQVAARVGSPLFTVDSTVPLALDGVDCGSGSLVGRVAKALRDGGSTLATAESCTGGRLAAMCTLLPGSSAWFLEGAVTYSNVAKMRQLGVTADALDAHGAVSEVVARQMAEGLRARSGATFALATTGVAGPDGGSVTKPVGTVHIALAGPDDTAHRLLRLAGDRDRIQALAAAAALDLLRRHLDGSLYATPSPTRSAS